MTHFELRLENGITAPVEVFRVLESTWIQQQHAHPSPAATPVDTMAAAEVNKIEVVSTSKLEIVNQCPILASCSIDFVA